MGKILSQKIGAFFWVFIVINPYMALQKLCLYSCSYILLEAAGQALETSMNDIWTNVTDFP